jgi:hypothetical protein
MRRAAVCSWVSIPEYRAFRAMVIEPRLGPLSTPADRVWHRPLERVRFREAETSS